jgi:hypothetical protein
MRVGKLEGNSREIQGNWRLSHLFSEVAGPVLSLERHGAKHIGHLQNTSMHVLSSLRVQECQPALRMTCQCRLNFRCNEQALGTHFYVGAVWAVSDGKINYRDWKLLQPRAAERK